MRPVVHRQLVDVEIGHHLDGVSGHAEAAGDLRTLTIQRGEQQAVQLAAREVVVDLKGHRALARAHRAEAEPQRCHACVDPTHARARDLMTTCF